MRAGILYAALLATALATPGFAADINISNFAGEIRVVEGNDGLDVVRRGSEGDLDYGTNGDRITVDGGLSRKDRGEACNVGGVSWNLSWNGRRSKGDTRLEDYPELEISVPAGSTVTIEESYIKLKSEVALGDVELELGGCFDVVLGDTGDMRLDKSGSGDFTAGTVGTLDVSKSGSGEISFGNAESLDLDKSGSGEFEIGDVSGPVKIGKSGSGDIEIASVNGSLHIHKSGSGDVEVNGGQVTDLEIRSSGSGDIDIDAPVVDADVKSSGSGDVYVESVSGRLRQSTSGSSDFNMGDD